MGCVSTCVFFNSFQQYFCNFHCTGLNLIGLVKVYFIFLPVFVDGIIFIISFLYGLLLLYRNSTDILCWFCLLHLLNVQNHELIL